jgi:hypothetical protein
VPAGLVDEVIALELLFAVPADLAADKHQRASGRDAVGVAAGFGPSGRLQGLQSFAGGSVA